MRSPARSAVSVSIVVRFLAMVPSSLFTIRFPASGFGYRRTTETRCVGSTLGEQGTSQEGRESRSNGDSDHAIQCHDLTKAFSGKRVLDGLNLAIPEGLISVVLGPSGTGKSVLIKHMIGLLFPDAGDVVVRGRSIP